MVLKNIIHRYLKRFRVIRRYRQELAENDLKKIILGSNEDKIDGWVSTNYPYLDITKFYSWFFVLRFKKVDNLLAEHVWEHLHIHQGKKAIKMCYFFLKKNGVLKIAVPDGFHESPDYIDCVKVGGVGKGADDHKVLYNYLMLKKILEDTGFNVTIREYWNQENKFILNNFEDESNGPIKRSFKNDSRNVNGKPNYTSLIIEGVK